MVKKRQGQEKGLDNYRQVELNIHSKTKRSVCHCFIPKIACKVTGGDNKKMSESVSQVSIDKLEMMNQLIWM